jgi:hypothetical protein
LPAVVTVVGIALVSGFLFFVLVAVGKPLLHALRTGPVPRIAPEPFRLPDTPPGLDGGSAGVREPRRPSPSGTAGAVALDRDD